MKLTIDGRQLSIPKRQFVDIAYPLIHGFVDNAVRQGVIDTTGKDEEQLAEEIVSFIGNLPKFKQALWSTDHTGDLLGEARRFCKLSNYKLACLHYATWLEHWMNGLVADLSRRKGLQDAQISAILRDVPYRAKPTWLLPVLGFPSLSAKHVRNLSEIGEIRNSFVHYKWKQHDIDSKEPWTERKRVKHAVEQAESTIRYLRSVERKFFFGRKKPHRFLTKKFMERLLASKERQGKGSARQD